MTEANSDTGGEGIKTYRRSIELKQKKDNWQRSMPISLGGIKSTDKTHWKNCPKAGGTCTVTYNAKNGVIIDWDNANFPIFTNYMHYLTENKLSIEDSGSYAGHLVKKQTEAMSLMIIYQQVHHLPSGHQVRLYMSKAETQSHLSLRT